MSGEAERAGTVIKRREQYMATALRRSCWRAGVGQKPEDISREDFERLLLPFGVAADTFCRCRPPPDRQEPQSEEIETKASPEEIAALEADLDRRIPGFSARLDSAGKTARQVWIFLGLAPVSNGIEPTGCEGR